MSRKIYRIKLSILGGALAAAVIMSAASIITVSADSHYAEPYLIAAPEVETRILRSYNNLVCIFDSPWSALPVEMTDIDVRTLPKSERELLVTGIVTTNMDELITLLECYSN